MSINSRTFGYAVLAAGFLVAAAPAFAAAGGGGGDGGTPSATSGSPTPNGMSTNSPAGSLSNPQHATPSSRRTAQTTPAHSSTPLKAPSSMGEGTAGTPNSHPALAPSNAVQTNNPMGSH
jgi:hypothetical protein